MHNKIRNEREVTTNTTEVQRIIKDHYEKLYADKLDSIPGPWGHDLSQRQMLDHWATRVSQDITIVNTNITMSKHLNT